MNDLTVTYLLYNFLMSQPTCMYTMIEFFFTVNINNVTTGTHFISPKQVTLHVGNDRLPEI